MKTSFLCIASVLLNNLICILSEVTILNAVQITYDRSPKLRIRGFGLDANLNDIILEISACGQQPLKSNKDYLISNDADGDGIILNLLGHRNWVNFEKCVPPVALTLMSVKFGAESTVNLLNQSVVVSTVLMTPFISTGICSSTNELRISGTGLIGAKKVDFYFQPPLVKGVAYEDVTKYPLTSDQVVLRLLPPSSPWQIDFGSRNIVAVDTGGGIVELNGDGVKVDDVQINLKTQGVTVEPTADRQLLYNDQTHLTIFGTGFNQIGNTLRFSNGILGNNVNYTTLSTSDISIALRLTPGSFWRKDNKNLPGALTLLAINTGEGFVAIGPKSAGKGRDVAMVFEIPTVLADNKKKLFRTHSHVLRIKGGGFLPTSTGYKTRLKFAPPLVVDVDYTIRVVDRTEIEITLVDGRAWRADAGPLLVKAINTRGDDAGWVMLPGDGVQVAAIQEDIDRDGGGGVSVFQSSVKIYQSALNQKMLVTGTGFQEGLSFSFKPSLSVGVDFNLEVASWNQAILRLKADKKWRKDAGAVIVKSVTTGKKTTILNGTEDVQVAIVLVDPVVTASQDIYHESQSKVVVIRGSGFTNVTKVVLRPTAPGAYKVLSVQEDTIRLKLTPGLTWLPSFMSLKNDYDSKRIALQIGSIDTGAGEVTFPQPVTVGYIVKDREGFTCDDSCEFAFNGVCDVSNDRYASVKADACLKGTDCTDCGGVDAISDNSKPAVPVSSLVTCTNTCIYPRDGVCDDPRGTKYCELGTDCQDCGAVGADNFTRSDDDGWWDDDDDYWTFNDVNFVDPAKGTDTNTPKTDSESGTQSDDGQVVGPPMILYFVIVLLVVLGYRLFTQIKQLEEEQESTSQQHDQQQEKQEGNDIEMSAVKTDDHTVMRHEVVPFEVVEVDEE